MEPTRPAWIDVALPLVQMIFFVVTAAAACASYRLARRTLLQPARTEVFKAQLEQLRIVLRMFAGKDELALRRDCGLDDLEEANFVRLYDDYARIVFGVQIEEEGRPYDRESCPQSRVTYASDELIRMPGPGDRTHEDTGQPVRLEWTDYDPREMRIPRAYVNFETALRDLESEPLLPERCVELIRSYASTVEHNLDAIHRLVQAEAPNLPTYLPRREDLRGASLAWMHNKANREFVPLRPAADEISSYVRSYLGADGIFAEASTGWGGRSAREVWAHSRAFATRNLTRNTDVPPRSTQA